MSESGSAGEQAPRDHAGRDQPQSRDEPAGAGDGTGAPATGDVGGGQRPLPADAHHAPDAWAELMRLADQVAAGRGVGALVPAWRRRARGEMRWPVTVTVAVAVVLQIQLADSLTRPLPHYLLPGLEIALGVGLFIANPVRFERRGKVVRAASIVLILLITGANAVSAILLIRAIILALPNTASALPLLASGASVWATNVIAFGLWYWEFDRGGPFHRAEGLRQYPDLMFPQMASPQLAAAGLAALLPRLPVPVVHERDRVQPDGRDAAVPLGQDHDGRAVGGGACRGGAGDRQGGQHPQVAAAGSFRGWPMITRR